MVVCPNCGHRPRVQVILDGFEVPYCDRCLIVLDVGESPPGACQACGQRRAVSREVVADPLGRQRVLAVCVRCRRAAAAQLERAVAGVVAVDRACTRRAHSPGVTFRIPPSTLRPAA